MVDWDLVDTVLLDMDGTLLDLNFDDYFWLEHVPQRWAEKYGSEAEAARERLLSQYRRLEGTLDWYCIDFWSKELGLDIMSLKYEVDHMIAVQPGVVEFLEAGRGAGKRCVLVTNAHGGSLGLKMQRTGLASHLDGIICAHDLGLPKEDPGFWSRLIQVEPFAPARTLLVDDSLPVLRSAEGFGIRFLLSVSRPNTRRAEREPGPFPQIGSFYDLIRGLEVVPAPAAREDQLLGAE
jgi:putative hydrolase of the HAD superfamily